MEYVDSFLQVYRQRSFIVAAQVQFIAQSTLSARIRALEELLETQLFIRNKSGVVLTESGKRFLPYALKLSDTYQKALQEFSCEPFDLSVGCLRTLSQNYFLSALEKFYQRYPNVTVHTMFGSSKKLSEAVSEGQCSFAFVHKLQYEVNLQLIPVFDEPIYLAVPLGHHFLSLTRSVMLEEISREPLLMKYNPVPRYWEDFLEMLQNRDLTVNIALQSDSFGVIIGMIKARRGIGLIPKMELEPHLADQSLSVVRFQSQPSLARTVCCIYPKAAMPSHLDFFVQEFRQMQSPDCI